MEHFVVICEQRINSSILSSYICFKLYLTYSHSDLKIKTKFILGQDEVQKKKILSRLYIKCMTNFRHCMKIITYFEIWNL